MPNPERGRSVRLERCKQNALVELNEEKLQEAAEAISTCDSALANQI